MILWLFLEDAAPDSHVVLVVQDDVVLAPACDLRNILLLEVLAEDVDLLGLVVKFVAHFINVVIIIANHHGILARVEILD